MVGWHRGIASPSGLYGIRALGLSCIGPPDWSTGLDCLRASNLGAGGFVMFLFFGVSYGMVRMAFQCWRQTSHRCRFTTSAGPWDFGDVLWGLKEFTFHIPSSGLIPHNSLLIQLHFDNYRKTRLLLCLTQLLMLKVAFWEEYLTEHLIVIARWNHNEKIYRMGWLEVIFSGLRRHGVQFTIFPD